MKIVRGYVQTAVGGAAGYKALLLDRETMKICSLLYGRSELADANVVHVERLDGNEEKHDHQELQAGLLSK